MICHSWEHGRVDRGGGKSDCERQMTEGDKTLRSRGGRSAAFLCARRGRFGDYRLLPRAGWGGVGRPRQQRLGLATIWPSFLMMMSTPLSGGLDEDPPCSYSCPRSCVREAADALHTKSGQRRTLNMHMPTIHPSIFYRFAPFGAVLGGGLNLGARGGVNPG